MVLGQCVTVITRGGIIRQGCRSSLSKHMVIGTCAEYFGAAFAPAFNVWSAGTSFTVS